MKIGKARCSALAALVVLGGIGSIGCNGDGEEDGGFTPAMVQGKTLYREMPDFEGLQKGLTTFTGATTLTDREVTTEGASETDGTWSIDADGRLLLVIGTNHITLTLQSETATSFQVLVDDGSGGGPASLELLKTVAAGAAFPGRYLVEDRDIFGVTQTVGIGTFGADGSASLTDGLSDDVGSWSALADGSIHLLTGKPEEVFLYLVAGSDTTPPKSLRMVGRVHDLGGLLGIADVTFDQTPAAGGFTHDMVVDQVVYRENTGENRSVIQYQSTGTRAEWSEGVSGKFYRTWDWEVTTGGALHVGPFPEVQRALLLIEDAATFWDVLVNDGTSLAPIHLTKTVVPTEAQVTGTWTVTERNLDGSTTAGGTVTLAEGGTGTDPGGGAVTWLITTDGWLVVTSETDVIYFKVLATSAPPAIELAGYVMTGGTTYDGLFVITLVPAT